MKYVNYDTRTASLLGPRIWDAISEDCQNANSRKVFIEKNKKWMPENFPCRICKKHVRDLDFCNFVNSI